MFCQIILLHVSNPWENSASVLKLKAIFSARFDWIVPWSSLFCQWTKSSLDRHYFVIGHSPLIIIILSVDTVPWSPLFCQWTQSLDRHLFVSGHSPLIVIILSVDTVPWSSLFCQWTQFLDRHLFVSAPSPLIVICLSVHPVPWKPGKARSIRM